MENSKRIARFWSKVKIGNPDECWEWQGCRNNYNYGVTSFGTTTMGTHKIAWILTNGEIPGGLLVLHKCDNPPCCNPNHLFLGTQKDNVQDARLKGHLSFAEIRPKIRFSNRGRK